MNDYGVTAAVRPSRLWFGVAAVLFAGMLACIFGAVDGFVAITDGSGSTESYTIGSHSGRSVARFTISRAGRYLLAAQAPTGQGPADVAVGQGLGDGLVAGVLLIIGGVFCFVGGLLIVIFTLIRRRRRVVIADPVWDQLGY